MRKGVLSALLLIILVGATLSVTLPAVTAQVDGVRVIRGPTPIQEAEGTSFEDITLMNEYLAVTFGVGTSPPWGVPKYNIIDLAPVINGTVGNDVLAQFSFPVNGWGNWAQLTMIEVVENTTERGVIRVVGYWKDIRLETTYVLEAGKNYLYIETKLTNEGSKPYKNLVSGYAISFKRGWTFTPGFGTGKHYKPTLKEEVGVIDDWVSGYHEDFAVGIWAPYFTHLSTSTSWVDPFTIHTLNPGETKTFIAYLIVEPIGSTCKLLEDIIKLKGLDYGTVTGSVTTAEGEVVEKPIVVVEKEGKPYCWAVGSDGRYEIKLPPGTYELHAVAKGYGPSSKQTVKVEAGTTKALDFTDVTSPGKVVINVFESGSGKPLDAKILIGGGTKTIVYYLQKATAYTDFGNIGRAEITLAPGIYTLTISHGGGFISKPVVLKDVVVESGGTVTYNVSIDILIRPNELGWYSADLHHHSDILDGRTPPKYLVLAQSAAALDFIFVSDHDSVARHKEIAKWASLRGKPFIPSVEISPAWAHFNPYPIPLGKDILYRGTACELFKAAREAGAIVIRVNHPYVTAGYFAAQERGEIPGGYCEDWDVAEINGRWDSSDNKTLTKMWSLWNLGLDYYLTAGSDVHDVWASPYTGSPRVYAYIPGEPTPEAFAYAEKNGRTFITYGPLVFTDPLPGSIVAVEDGTIVNVSINIFAVDNVSRLVVVSKGKFLVDEKITEGALRYTYTFSAPANELLGNDTISWISVMVWDSDGDIAITNPIWVSKKVVKPVTTKTVTMSVTHTVTTTETYTTTTVEKETVTTVSVETKVITSTVTTTSTTEVEVVKWDVTAGIAILTLIIGVIISYVALRRKKY
ncbi:MAG: hypothetical protein DRO18_03030 [Thermoprotei archaeon]|nr:MAG: hypothetical protein DRO18_03030 [Thermoprotei archaeon]